MLSQFDVSHRTREIRAMSVAVRVDREGDHASLVPAGPFDLAHTTAVARAMEGTVTCLSGCATVDVDLAHLDAESTAPLKRTVSECSTFLASSLCHY